MKARVLIVDDDKNFLDLLSLRLQSEGYEVIGVADENKALKALSENEIHVAILDLQLKRTDGIALMNQLHLVRPELPIIILTAYGSIESAVKAMQKGAFTYLTKPFDKKELLAHLEKALEKGALTKEIKRLRSLVNEEYSFTNIVAKSPAMRQVLKLVAQIAPTDSTVLIQGESGTGKELIAKAIHLASPRAEGPFVALNCAALPESLLESELFGHEKGAFTGAVTASKGLFAAAHRGTIFLDEIGDMPLSIQAKLLRVLQEKKFYPLGSEKPVKVDVRIVAATNKDLWQEVEKGHFRRDLFYRIHVIPIKLPPLRERKEDIPYLVKHFIRKHAPRLGKEVKRIDEAALKKLLRYNWPGNIRELENVIEYALIMTESDKIKKEHIFLPEGDDVEIKTFKEAKTEFERDYLCQVLRITQGNISKAASLAGKYRADFYKLLRKHNIDPKEFKIKISSD